MDPPSFSSTFSFLLSFLHFPPSCMNLFIGWFRTKSVASVSLFLLSPGLSLNLLPSSPPLSLSLSHIIVKQRLRQWYLTSSSLYAIPSPKPIFYHIYIHTQYIYTPTKIFEHLRLLGFCNNKMFRSLMKMTASLYYLHGQCQSIYDYAPTHSIQ